MPTAHPTTAAAEADAAADRSRQPRCRALTEVITLGWTLKRRADDVLAYFDRPDISNDPTGAINVRLEHLRRSTLGFRNLTHYVARSLLEAAGSDPDYTFNYEEPVVLLDEVFGALGASIGVSAAS